MTDREDDDIQAAEYIIGLMPLADRKEFETRLQTDTILAAHVNDWTDRLAPFNADYADSAPPPAVKDAIDQRLFASPVGRGNWWSALRIRWAVITAALAAVVLVLGLQILQAQPKLVAQLDPVEMGYRFAATYNRDTGVLTVSTLEAVDIPDRALELWAIGEAGVPMSLGLLTASEDFAISTGLKLQPGTTLAVSLEPLGGSRTGAPTGPVLSAGVLSDV
ncbi:anti-sigma factor [uncultured Roseobacter sp.]|uniref:anti-sigma factor n=1 Tax=uncultured Roseobacter sp. TaxID=114847 RepID=UPI00260BE740|nr:anti-sigma factor [uncultured Roseobacter sp.]